MAPAMPGALLARWLLKLGLSAQNVAGMARLFGAILLGSVLVSGGSTAIAAAAAPSKAFSAADQERFDQNSFLGRWAKMLYDCDPSTLLTSSSAVIKSTRKLHAAIQASRGGGVKQAQSAAGVGTDLWTCKRLQDSAVDVTGKVIPRPFRMSGYVPYNGPLCVGMMQSSSIAAILFWNIANQSQNALINYYNRSTEGGSNSTLIASYLTAVAAAISVSLGLSTLVKLKFAPATAAIIFKFSALPTSIAASCTNCYVMRRSEIAPGIVLFDAKGIEVQSTGGGELRSSIAARKAVYQTVISRFLLQWPVFCLPLLVSYIPAVARLTAAAPNWALPLDMLLTMLGFGFGLPAALASFPVMGSIMVSKLEPKFAAGRPAGEVLCFNKGL